MKPTTPQAMTQAASMKPPYRESAKKQPAPPPPLAAARGRRLEGAVPMRRGRGEGERQVERRFRHGEAAGEAGVEILTTYRDRRPPAEQGDQECQTGWGEDA